MEDEWMGAGWIAEMMDERREWVEEMLMRKDVTFEKWCVVRLVGCERGDVYRL